MIHLRSGLVSLPALLLLLGGGLLACAKIPVTHHYVLELKGAAPSQEVTGGDGPGLSIGVETFRVDSPYDQDRIVYRIGDGSTEVGFYAYHRWAAPLARLVPRLVADGLRAAPASVLLEPAYPGRQYDARLEGRVLAFEEIDTPRGQEVHVRIHLHLRSPGGQTLWARDLEATRPARARDVAAVAEEMSLALSEAVLGVRASFAEALAAYLEKSR